MKVSRVLRVGAVIGAASAVLIAAARSNTKSECEEAREWVAEHATSLPQTLGELEKFSMAYRRQIHAALPAAVRAALWREHFSRFLGEGSTLSAEQQAFVREISDRADDFVSRRALEGEVREKMLALFPLQEAARIFASLGATDDPALTGNPDVAPARSSCTCSASGTNFCSITSCLSNGCLGAPTGCGFMWCQPCDGTCNGAEQE